MCDCSKLKLPGNHALNACPVTAALYCSICQQQGHPTMKCPQRDIWHYRKPEFVEQFIPKAVLDNYKIMTKTPICPGPHKHMPYIHGDPVIEILQDEDGKNVRATLSSFNLPCSSVKENKRVMEAYGELTGQEVVYIDSGVTPVVVKKGRKAKA